MTRFQRLALALVLAASAAPALAEDFKAGDISIQKPWARATPKGADIGVAYFVIRNTGAKPDRLTGGKADFGNVEIHEMKMDGTVMRMRELDNGVALPAGQAVELKPGGYHVMFIGLKAPFAKGQKVPATLVFEKAGKVDIEFLVEALGATQPSVRP